MVVWISGGFESLKLFNDWFQTLSFFGPLLLSIGKTRRLPSKHSKATADEQGMWPITDRFGTITTDDSYWAFVIGRYSLALRLAQTISASLRAKTC